jgi:hypothetical protein
VGTKYLRFVELKNRRQTNAPDSFQRAMGREVTRERGMKLRSCNSFSRRALVEAT